MGSLLWFQYYLQSVYNRLHKQQLINQSPSAKITECPELNLVEAMG